MSGLVKTFYDAVTASLAGTAPCFRGTDKAWRSAKPPKYVWVRTPSRPTSPIQQLNRNPPLAAAKLVVFEVHCFGANDDDLEAMEAALFTAVRKQKSGSKSKFEYFEHEDFTQLTDGLCESIRVLAYFEVPLSTLPTTAAVAGDSPASSTTSATLPAVVGAVLEHEAASGGDFGDGELTEDEP